MAKSRKYSKKSKSRSRSRRKISRPHKFLVKKTEGCPSGYLKTFEVKRNSKKYGTKLPSFCVEFPMMKKSKGKSRKSLKGSRKTSRKGSKKVSRKMSRKYKFIGIDEKN
jgi:hypothetical protein